MFTCDECGIWIRNGLMFFDGPKHFCIGCSKKLQLTPTAHHAFITILTRIFRFDTEEDTTQEEDDET
jgi:hypothetical protein